MSFEHIPNQEQQPLNKNQIVERFRETHAQESVDLHEVPESVRKMQPDFIVEEVAERIHELRESFPSLKDATPAEVGNFANKEAWRIREQQYTFDENTQLQNKDFIKRYLQEIIEKELLEEGNESFEHICHMTVDLNGLKAVNDLSGHDKGDEYLRRVSEWLWSSDTLNKAKRDGAEILVARTGGDEFAITVVGDPNQEWNEDAWKEMRLQLQFEIESLNVADLIDSKKIKEVVPDAPDTTTFRASAGIGFATLEKALANTPVNNKNTVTEQSEDETISSNLMGSMLDTSDKNMYEHKRKYKRFRGSNEGDLEENALSALLHRTDESRELQDRIRELEAQLMELRNKR